jgi:hypothetical protein
MIVVEHKKLSYSFNNQTTSGIRKGFSDIELSGKAQEKSFT